MNIWDNWNNCLKPTFRIDRDILWTILENEQHTDYIQYTILGPASDADGDAGNLITVGQIHVLFDYINRDLYVFSLDTHPEFRGQGVGTFLLRYVAVEANAIKPTNLLTIHLDDMSDESANSAKNIYRKIGMVPETVMDQPEREGLIVNLQSNAGWKRFCKHYLKGNTNKVFRNNEECPCN